ncbi:MAG TPA: PilZ domain-containing protein [Nitrospirota bacterium]
MKTRMEDRRGFVRVPFNTDVEVDVQGRKIRSCEGVNISMSGIRIGTTEEIPPQGTPCRVHIFLQASDKRVSLRANGKVVRSAAGGLAVEFADIDLDSYHHLRNLILNNTDDPEKAEKEFTTHWGIRRPES